MYTRDEIAEDLSARREALMERAEELRAEFADRVDEDTVANFTGWTLISSGLAWGVTKWMRGDRTFVSLLVPIGLIAAGAAVLGGTVAWHRRASHISETELRIREELAGLGPIARMQALRGAANEAVPFIRHINVRN